MFKTLLKLFEMTFYGSGSVSVPRNRKKDGFRSVPVRFQFQEIEKNRFRFGFGSKRSVPVRFSVLFFLEPPYSSVEPI